MAKNYKGRIMFIESTIDKTDSNTLLIHIIGNRLYHPKKIIVNNMMSESENETVFFQRTYCYINVKVTKDYDSIESCTCSACSHEIDIFSKFCSNCGAKSKGRKIIETED